jgi:hypothetical protein
MFPALTRPHAAQIVDLRGGSIEAIFDAWVFAAGDAARALERWLDSSDDRGSAYAAYRASLEREDKAAAVLGVAFAALD